METGCCRPQWPDYRAKAFVDRAHEILSTTAAERSNAKKKRATGFRPLDYLSRRRHSGAPLSTPARGAPVSTPETVGRTPSRSTTWNNGTETAWAAINGS